MSTTIVHITSYTMLLLNTSFYDFLGDSGYALQPYLLTPLENVNTRARQLYNESIIRTRNIIERTIGLWKSRFPCLAYGMRLKTDTVLTVIIATAVLHNIAKDMNEEEPPVANQEMINYLLEIGQIANNPVDMQNVGAVQNEIINNYFHPLI